MIKIWSDIIKFDFTYHITYHDHNYFNAFAYVNSLVWIYND